MSHGLVVWKGSHRNMFASVTQKTGLEAGGCPFGPQEMVCALLRLSPAELPVSSSGVPCAGHADAAAGCAGRLRESLGGATAEGCGACSTCLRLVEACLSAHLFHHRSEETLGLKFPPPPPSSRRRSSRGSGAGAALRFPKRGGVARRQTSC